MNFCPYCGEKIVVSEARFCMNCGKSLDSFRTQATPEPIPISKIKSSAGEHSIDAPMPGKIVELVAEEGDFVRAGDVMLILEAMKMQNEIIADTDGIVKKFNIAAGQFVKVRESLVILAKCSSDDMLVARKKKINTQKKSKTRQPFKIQGRGVIAGFDEGTILLAGESLDAHLAAYRPSSKSQEKKKAAKALVAVAQNLKKSIDSFKAQGFNEQAGILEAHRMMVEDPAMSGAIYEQVDISGSAPKAVLDAYEAQAQVFESMEDEYFNNRAVDMRDVGKRIAKYLLGIKDPEIVGKVIVAGKDIEPSIIAGLPTDKIAGVILAENSPTADAILIAKVRAIPTVIGVGVAINQIADGDLATLNGANGEISINKR